MPSSEVRKVNRLPVLYFIAVLLSVIALSISGYLSYVAFTSSKIAGCGGGTFNCEHVLTSKWSTLLGVPVAAMASALYLSVLATLVVTARPALSSVPSPMRTASWGIVTTAAVSAALAALWFIGLQVFVLEHLCPWCLGAHACSLLLCASVLAMGPLPVRVKAACAVVGTVGAALMIGIQVATPAPPTYIIEQFPAPNVEVVPGAGVIEEPEMFDAPAEGDDVLTAPGTESSAIFSPDDEAQAHIGSMQWAALAWLQPSLFLTTQVGNAGQPAPSGTQNQGQNPAASGQGATAQGADAVQGTSEDRLVQVASANVKLKAHQWPIIGSPNAKHIFVELFDYTCPHCRATQRAIRGAREHFRDDLAVIVLAVPLSRACNDTVTTEHPSHRESCELAKYSVAVWRISPEKFQEYHEWLLSVEPVPSAAAAKAKAAQLVGGAALEQELAQPHAARYISKHVEVYRKMGAGPIPKLVFATTALTGEMTDAGVLIRTIHSQAGR